MSVVETNLVRCCKCDAVYIYDDIITPPTAGFRPCPNCDKIGTLIPVCTTSDSVRPVFFKRMTDVEVEKMPAKNSVRVAGRSVSTARMD